MKSITIQKVNKGYIVNAWANYRECVSGEPYVYTSIKDLQNDLPDLLKEGGAGDMTVDTKQCPS